MKRSKALTPHSVRSKALTDMIWYIENPKNSIRKLLELISEFSKVARIQNQYTEITCISIYNEKSGREIKESIPFTIATKQLNF